MAEAEDWNRKRSDDGREAVARKRGRRKAVLASWMRTMDENEDRRVKLALPALQSDVMDERM